MISNNREWWFLSTIAVPYLQAFFRRAITDKNKYACLKENSCEITAQKRGNCSACRLQKCFDLGMSKSGQFHEAIVKLIFKSNDRWLSVWKYCYIQQPIKNYKYLDSLALFQTIQFISWPCPFKVKYCIEYLSFWKAVRQGRYTIELRTNTILEVKRLANKTAVEVSVDSQKNKPAKQTCPDPSANTGPCDMETEEYSQSMGQSVRGETSSCDSDMALSLLSTDNGLNSPDCEFILIIIFFF